MAGVRWTRVMLVCAAAGAAMLAAGAVAPLPPGVEAMTLCYPGLGPVTRLQPSLTDSVRRRTDAHEASHRADCERLGSFRHYLAIATPRGRLAAEARAGCAETRHQIDAGANPYLEVERAVDELLYGYPWIQRLGEGAVRAAMADTCPDLVRRGGRPPWSGRRRPRMQERGPMRPALLSRDGGI